MEMYFVEFGSCNTVVLSRHHTIEISGECLGGEEVIEFSLLAD